MQRFFETLAGQLDARGAFDPIGIQGATQKNQAAGAIVEKPVYPGSYSPAFRITPADVPQCAMDLQEAAVTTALQIYLPEKHFLSWAGAYVENVICKGFPEELTTQIHLWAARMRKVQDDVFESLREDDTFLNGQPKGLAQIHRGLQVLQEEPELLVTVATYYAPHLFFLDNFKAAVISGLTGERQARAVGAIDALTAIFKRSSFELPLAQLAIRRYDVPLAQRAPVVGEEFKKTWLELQDISFHNTHYDISDAGGTTEVWCSYRHRARRMAPLEVCPAHRGEKETRLVTSHTFSGIYGLLRGYKEAPHVRAAHREVARIVDPGATHHLALLEAAQLG